MKKKQITILMIFALLVVELSIFSANNLNTISLNDTPEGISPSDELIVMKDIGVGGEEQVLSNTAVNENFEEADIDGRPTDWDTYASTESYANATTYNVYDGTYSGLVSSKGNSRIGGTSYLAKYVYMDSPLLKQGLDLEFYYNIIANPDIDSTGELYFRIQIASSGSWYNIYYMLSFAHGINNYTTQAYYDMNSTLYTWHQFSRNITNDFIQALGAYPIDAYVYDISIRSYSPNDPSGYTECLLDNVIMNNNWAVPKYFVDASNNGGFESEVSGWGYNNQGRGYTSLSDDRTEGLKSLNMTATNDRDNSYGYTNAYYYIVDWGETPPRGLYATKPDELVIEFDWKYSQSSINGNQQYSYISLAFYNDSYSVYLYIYIGAYSGYSISGNYSGPGYGYNFTSVDNYGSEDTWEHYRLDIWDFIEENNYYNMTLTEFYFDTYSGNDAGSWTTLLLDDFKLWTYPIGDPGFEQDWYYTGSQQFTGWRTQGAAPYVDRTSDARSGDWAANLTSYNGIGGISTFISRTIDVTPYLYTDFWWKLDQPITDGSSSEYACIYFQLDTGEYLYYILAADEDALSSNLVNQSTELYIVLDNYNQTGTWFNLVRNINSDLNSYFSPRDWVITRSHIYVYASSGGVVSVILDDLHFVEDTTPPVVADISFLSPPVYYNPTTILLEVIDGLSSVDTVILSYYYLGWNDIVATDTGGGIYSATVPAFDYGEGIEYYITVNDTLGRTDIDDNGGLNYLYTVDDDVDPVGSITTPINESTVSDDIDISVDCWDIGSGIDYVQFFRGGILIDTISSAPYEIVYPTRTLTNGTYTFRAIIYDNAGNSFEDSIIVEVANDFTEPVISSVVINPLEPVYEEEVEIIVGVIDQSAISEVNLWYKIGAAGTWVSTPMLQDGVLYKASIAGQPWDTQVFYYIEAIDDYDQASYVGYFDSPLDYIVADLIDPTLDVSGPNTLEIISENVTFFIDGYDLGSGIAVFEILIDGEVVHSSSTIPEEYIWITRDYENGNHTILFALEDNAGNLKTLTYEYEVKNQRPSTLGFISFFQTWGALFGAGLAGAGIGTFYLIRWRRAKIA